ncbi:Nitroreductase [Lactococcus lactis subsp. lactis NCDO 2118]|uniref:Nitroreductase family protein n=2 Tax=Lactococcus lactis subsp. lactis TaxID=1360 RepID=S6EVM2_LACLL|nr:Nitroreductase [Lactococcus lactis subsp. lactis NCDO 2118]MDU0403217.1 putative NAD(P)H nitroreductase [Lactococcus lactis]CDG03478.1 Nitroreductase family protein [Lactococcus lactis subsp. lactis A12]SBW29352.1 Nitroreductase family protein [Lactococcus lactis subsp. lactis]
MDVKQIISAASLAPSAHNIQSWHFVIVESEEKREALLSEVDPGNHEQIKQAGAVIVLFSDTDLVERSRDIARLGAGELDDEQLLRFNSRYPQMYEGFEELHESNYLSINIGLVTMNLVLAIKNYGYESNIIMGFNRTQKVNELLEVEKRYRPELIIPLGNSEDKGKPSYRLPQSQIMEIR